MTRQPASRRARWWAGCAVLSALLLSGCGSLQPHADIVRAAGGGTSAQSLAPGTVDGSAGGSTTTGGAGSPGSTGIGGSGAGSGSTGSTGSTGTASGTGGTTGTTTGIAPGGTTGTTSGSGSGTGTTGAGQDHSVVTIGNVSTTSGIAGGAQRPGVVGLQAWVQLTNARGGINGHQIKLIARDDQNDPNQNASYTQALVEQAHVIAFVSNWASQTQAASAGYLKSRSVPVVGGDHTGDNSWGINPMFFPTAAIGQDAVRNTVAALAQVAVPQHKTKLGIISCAEGGICATGAKTSADYAPKVGFSVAYNGTQSFAAPDYTANCLSMRNAGVQAVTVIFPASATKNIGRDCARQGLKVIYGLANGTMEGDFHEDPNFEGAAVQNSAFPFSASSTAVQRDYQTAMRKYAPNQISNPASASGFASGVVFGAALAKVQGQVTSAKLLAALHSFKEATFGGATIPLTFTRGPMTPRSCYFLSIISHGGYVVQNGGKFLCRP